MIVIIGKVGGPDSRQGVTWSLLQEEGSWQALIWYTGTTAYLLQKAEPLCSGVLKNHKPRRINFVLNQNFPRYCQHFQSSEEQITKWYTISTKVPVSLLVDDLGQFASWRGYELSVWSCSTPPPPPPPPAP